MKPPGTLHERAIEVKREHNQDLGGDTYWVRTTDWPDEFRALCWRKRRVGGFCGASAGKGTDHPGSGACHIHERRTADEYVIQRLTNGRQAMTTRRSLKSRVDKFVEEDQGDLFDLTKELALQRVLLEELKEEYDEVEQKAKGVMQRRMLEQVTAIRQTIEAISKIQSRDALTAAHVLYLRATVADILIQYIDDPKKREMAVRTLVTRVAGGENGDDSKIVRIAQEL